MYGIFFQQIGTLLETVFENVNRIILCYMIILMLIKTTCHMKKSLIIAILKFINFSFVC